MQWLFPFRLEWPQLVIEPFWPAYAPSAVAWRVWLDRIFCAGLAVWMGWSYLGGNIWCNSLTLIGTGIGLPWLLLLVSERPELAVNNWDLFWLPLQLMPIMLLGQSVGWLLAWIRSRSATPSH